jgi:uncharacterized protein (TIGR03086 family)
MILAGADDDAVLATHQSDFLAVDPVGAYWSGLEEVTQAFERDGALSATVHHPKSGSMSGAQLRVLRVHELTVHAWDLARATGGDEELDGDVVRWLDERLDPIWDTLAQSGLYADPVQEVGRPDSSQSILLRRLGRRP